jgi:hypothetical protein
VLCCRGCTQPLCVIVLCTRVDLMIDEESASTGQIISSILRKKNEAAPDNHLPFFGPMKCNWLLFSAPTQPFSTMFTLLLLLYVHTTLFNYASDVLYIVLHLFVVPHFSAVSRGRPLAGRFPPFSPQLCSPFKFCAASPPARAVTTASIYYIIKT